MAVQYRYTLLEKFFALTKISGDKNNKIECRQHRF